MRFAKKDLFRVLLLADGSFVLDQTGKQGGRGAYLCKDIKCIFVASKSKGLERSFGLLAGNKNRNPMNDLETSIYKQLEMKLER